MNRNTESHFATVPILDVRRSKFKRPHDHKSTFNVGELVPIFYDGTIMPGDTVKMRMSEIIRMMTPITPVMDMMWCDTYFFFVPYRLIWEHFKQFWGENDTAPWTQTNEYKIPKIKAPENGWLKGSLADHLGYPTKIGGYEKSALPFRAYVAIVNRWFRDQNLKNPCYLTLGDATIQGTDKTTLGANYDYVTDTEKGAAPFIVARTQDMFSTALPEPQKGPDVNVPLGETARVIGVEPDYLYRQDQPLWTNGVNKNLAMTRGQSDELIYSDEEQAETIPSKQTIGLAADLSNAVGATINQLRQAYAIQKFYENTARGGSRYIEQIKTHFRVQSSDARMQDPEYIGGKRIPISINQVVGHDQGAEIPIGTTGAYSVTTDKNEDLFTFSAEEHGCIMGLACIRTEHSFQQGINRQFSMEDLFDFYTPELANLGEVSVKNDEIYLDGTDADKEVWGFQEAYYWYRYYPNQICGELRSNYDQSLDIWHWGDYYEQRPTLSSEWIDEPRENVDRTIAIQNHDQFFADFYFEPIYTRPMPLYSVPGLTGHY